MLTQLSTVKSRLSIPDADTTSDALLTSAITALSARFDKETNRTLARTVSATQEFPGEDTEITLDCYPVEKVGLKTFWPSGDAYRQFAGLDLLDSVKATLAHYRRSSL